MSDTRLENPSNSDAGYAFLSYAHADEHRIAPYIYLLQQTGCRLWFDVGIVPGDEWPESIARALKNADVCLVFLSANSLNSQNVKREINYAISHNINLVCVYLEACRLSPGMEMQLGISPSVDLTKRVSTEDAAGHIRALLPESVYRPADEMSDSAKRKPAQERHGMTRTSERDQKKNKAVWIVPVVLLWVLAVLAAVLFFRKRNLQSETTSVVSEESVTESTGSVSEPEEFSFSEAESVLESSSTSEPAETPVQNADETDQEETRTDGGIPAVRVLNHLAEDGETVYSEIIADDTHSEELLASLSEYNSRMKGEASTGSLQSLRALVARDDSAVFSVVLQNTSGSGIASTGGVSYDALDGHRLVIKDCVRSLPDLVKAIVDDNDNLMHNTDDDYERDVESDLKNRECWWLGNEGLHYVSENEEVTVTYADYPELFFERFTKPADECMTLLTETAGGETAWYYFDRAETDQSHAWRLEVTPNEDLTGIRIYAVTPDVSEPVIIKESEKIPLESEWDLVNKAYHISKGENEYFLVQTSEDGASYECTLVLLASSGPTVVQSIPGYIDEGAVSPYSFYLCEGPVSDGETESGQICYIDETGFHVEPDNEEENVESEEETVENDEYQLPVSADETYVTQTGSDPQELTEETHHTDYIYDRDAGKLFVTGDVTAIYLPLADFRYEKTRDALFAFGTTAFFETIAPVAMASCPLIRSGELKTLSYKRDEEGYSNQFDRTYEFHAEDGILVSCEVTYPKEKEDIILFSYLYDEEGYLQKISVYHKYESDAKEFWEDFSTGTYTFEYENKALTKALVMLEQEEDGDVVPGTVERNENGRINQIISITNNPGTRQAYTYDEAGRLQGINTYHIADTGPDAVPYTANTFSFDDMSKITGYSRATRISASNVVYNYGENTADITAEPEAAADENMYERYAEIVRKHNEGFAMFQQDPQVDFEKEFGDDVKWHSELEYVKTILFSLLDLNEDGVDELIVEGLTENSLVPLEAFIYRNGKVERIDDTLPFGGYRASALIYEGNMIVKFESGGAEVNSRTNYRLRGTDLVTVEGISSDWGDVFERCDGYEDGDSYVDADYQKSHRISEEEFNEQYNAGNAATLHAFPVTEANLNALQEGNKNSLEEGADYQQGSW